MTTYWQVISQCDDDRLTSDGGIWWRYIDKWYHNMMTIDLQVMAEYDDDRLTSDIAIWW